MRIDKKYERLIFSIVMSCLMSFIMSGAITLINIGTTDFFHHWMVAWLPAWGLAFIAINLVLPIVHKIVKKLLKETL